MKPCWYTSPKTCFGVGIACGRFRTSDGKTFTMLRNEDGHERCFSDSELSPVSKDEVAELNRVLESMRYKSRVRLSPEPIRHAGTDAFTPHIWCHKCGTGRQDFGKCPNGCKEKHIAEDIPLDAPLGQKEKT